jgi:hypothetical protein
MKNMRRTKTLTSFLAIVLFFALKGNLRALETLTVPSAAAAPVIDGKLDEEIWSKALKFDAFLTFKPDYGKEPSQKTEAYITYDAENIYFGIRCYDTEPSKVKAVISKRDAIFQDDLIGIILDTFNDTESGFGFMINPLGIQGDGMLDFNGNLEGSHDMVWYSKGEIDDKGWVVEARVPLQSIRFPKKDTLTMRVLFFRFFTRTSEQASYPPIDPDKGSIMTQSQPIQVTGLKYKRVVELLPAITHSTQHAASDGRMKKLDSQTDLGLTGKVGLTSDLTLDAAVNPDFSQVESDAGQIDVNLRYALYFPEKRPFFLEGNDIWRFGGLMEDSPLQMMVHTRTIIDPIFGFKLTGKLSPRGTVAAIYAKDDLPGDPVDERPDFTIVRYRHSLKEDSFLGTFYTGRAYGKGFNRVAGVDGRIRLNDKSVASFHLFGSSTRNPGSDETSTDHALSLYYNYYSRKWYLDLGYQDVSQRFQVDTGYVYRTGLRRLAAFAMYQIYPKSKFFQKVEPFYWSQHQYDTFYSKWETFNIFVLRSYLPRNTMVRLEGILANEVWADQKFDKSGFGARSESQLFKQLYLSFYFRRTGSIFYDPYSPFQGRSNRLGVVADYQPTDKLDFTVSLNYSDFFRKSDKEKIYDYTILRSFNTFQVNKYFFLRAIFEYNFYRERLTVDTLASFTYIPGTVIHVGYGSAFERLEWTGVSYIESGRFLETKRGFFFKVSYLWRM